MSKTKQQKIEETEKPNEDLRLTEEELKIIKELRSRDRELELIKKKKELARKEHELKLAKQYEKDSNKVRGKFKFHEVPGGTLRFSFKMYPQEKTKYYELVDEGIYSIPLNVAKHLNTSGKIKIHTHKTNKNGKPHIEVGRIISRYSFNSLDFLDVSDPDVVQAIGPSNIEVI